MHPVPSSRRTVIPAVPAALAVFLLSACAAAFNVSSVHAADRHAVLEHRWPAPWQDDGPQAQIDFTPPAFDAPSAQHCNRLPTTREVPGAGAEQPVSRRRFRGGSEESRVLADEARPAEARRERADAGAAARFEDKLAKSAAPAPVIESIPERAPAGMASQIAPHPSAQRPAQESVNAGMVDDNADFGEYLNYRQRHAGLPVRERDVSERYLLEVTDRHGRPVHDAEVAVQRPGVAQPVMWARTDTAGRVWVHPKAFLSPALANERVLGVAVRKGVTQARAVLARGQSQAVQVRLGTQAEVARPRLDLVFLVDATGSMGDEIAKLKTSMRAMSQQISQLPGQPDICYGLVAYRDKGDAYLTRTHDFTHDLAAFQGVLARVQADGGGDTPEALNEALQEAVHRLSWRTEAARMVVLVADAPPHLNDGALPYDAGMQAALAKGIKLFAVGASGLDPVGEYVYRQMAQYTAGRFVFLTYKDASNPGSGPGSQTGHDVKQYSVQTLDKLVVRLVGEELARLRGA
jgi:Mg-chelatase subunit ChlD